MQIYKCRPVGIFIRTLLHLPPSDSTVSEEAGIEPRLAVATCGIGIQTAVKIVHCTTSIHLLTAFSLFPLPVNETGTAFKYFKGTVRPDWICMRVVSMESLLKGHQPLWVIIFFISLLNILADLKVLSRFMQN